MAHLAIVACAEMPSHSSGPGNIRVRVRVSFTTVAVRSATLATAGLLVQVSPPSNVLSTALILVFTARCTIVQSVILLSHVVCPSVRLSVCLSVCDVGGSRPHRLKILETNCTNNSPNIFILRRPKAIHLHQENREKFWGD